jgi:hypothetical protein
MPTARPLPAFKAQLDAQVSNSEELPPGRIGHFCFRQMAQNSQSDTLKFDEKQTQGEVMSDPGKKRSCQKFRSPVGPGICEEGAKVEY